MKLHEVDLAQCAGGRHKGIGGGPVGEEILVVELVLPHQLHGQTLGVGLLRQGEANVIAVGLELRLQHRAAVGGQTTVVADDVLSRNAKDVNALLELVRAPAAGPQEEKKSKKGAGDMAQARGQ